MLSAMHHTPCTGRAQRGRVSPERNEDTDLGLARDRRV